MAYKLYSERSVRLTLRNVTVGPTFIRIYSVTPRTADVVRVTAVIVLVSDRRVTMFMRRLTVPALAQVPWLSHILGPEIQSTLRIRVWKTLQRRGYCDQIYVYMKEYDWNSILYKLIHFSNFFETDRLWLHLKS